MLPDDELTPERIAMLRQMTPQQRLQEATRMYWEARRLTANLIRNQNPDWNEEGVQVEVRRIFLAEAMKEG